MEEINRKYNDFKSFLNCEIDNDNEMKVYLCRQFLEENFENFGLSLSSLDISEIYSDEDEDDNLSYTDDKKNVSRIIDCIITKMAKIGQLKTKIFLDGTCYVIQIIDKKEINEESKKYIHDTVSIV